MTAKESLFLDEYFKDLHQTNAAIRIGVPVTNAPQWASTTMAKPNIREEVEKRKAALSQKAGLIPEQIIERLKAHALGDRSAIMTDKGELKPLDEWPDEARALVVGVKASTVYNSKGESLGVVTEVTLTKPDKYFDMLMKYAGMYEKDNKQKSPKIRIGYGSKGD